MNELEMNLNKNNNDFDAYKILLILWNRKLLISIVVILATSATFVFNISIGQIYRCNLFLEIPYVVTGITKTGINITEKKDIFINFNDIKSYLTAFRALNTDYKIESLGFEKIKKDTVKISVNLPDVSIIENLASHMLAYINQSKAVAVKREELKSLFEAKTDALQNEILSQKNTFFNEKKSLQDKLLIKQSDLSVKKTELIVRRMQLNELPDIIEELEEKKLLIDKRVKNGEIMNPDYDSYINLNILISDKKVSIKQIESILKQTESELEMMEQDIIDFNKIIESHNKEAKPEKKSYDSSIEKLKLLREEIAETTNFRWIKKPVIQESPVKPQTMKNVALAMPVSLMFGIFLSLFLEYIKINNARRES